MARLLAVATLLTLGLSASACSSSEVVTCTCCDGTTAETTVCDDCMYIVPPCQSACGTHLWPPMCGPGVDAGSDAGRDAGP